MSERADLDRTMRQMWARSGSSHDRVVRILRYGLPLVIGVVAAVLVFSPFTQRAEISFLLAKDKVDMASERMKVTRAEYRGQDANGQPFALLAGSAGEIHGAAVLRIVSILLIPFILGQSLQRWLRPWVLAHRGLATFMDRTAIAIAVYVAFSAAVVAVKEVTDKEGFSFKLEVLEVLEE